MVSFRSALPLVFAAALFVFEERASTPSCDVAHTIVPRAGREGDGGGAAVGNSSGELKVMMVGNLLIMGSDTRYLDVFFRNPFLANFFRKSFDYLKPDMLVVLGDISVNGWHLTHGKWLSTVEQFQKIVGPFMGIPLHVMLGDRDIGRCSDPDINSIRRMTRSLPGLDSVGCSSFEISNISFLSLNTMALLCGQNNLRFSVEKVIERESSFLQSVSQGTTETSNCSIDVEKGFDLFGWRTNTLQPGAGPVLLLHFPLHRKFSNCGRTKSLNECSNNWEKCCCIGSSAYDTVPANATEYIFQALRPRVVFSAHTQCFCNYVHADGTHEITVPPMSWDLTDEPSFVVVKFREGSGMTVSICVLGRKSHVLMAYLSILVLLIPIILFAIAS